MSNGEVFSIGVDRRTDDEQNEQRDYDDFVRLRVHILSLSLGIQRRIIS